MLRFCYCCYKTIKTEIYYGIGPGLAPICSLECTSKNRSLARNNTQKLDSRRTVLTLTEREEDELWLFLSDLYQETINMEK